MLYLALFQVARCTKIINADSDDPKYIINVKQFAKFVVDLSDQVAPTDIEEGMRVGVDRNKYQIHIPLPPKIDPTVTMMQVSFLPFVPNLHIIRKSCYHMTLCNHFFKKLYCSASKNVTKVFTCLKSLIETLEKGVKYI